MTENEAIEILTLSNDMKKKLPNLQEVYEFAVKALEEIQQYRNLGTIEFLTDMKSNYVEVLSDLRQYQKIGTVEECRQNKAIAETAISGKWIPCSEQLPKRHIDVLVSLSDYGCVMAWYSEVNKCWKSSSTDNVITSKVIAWQQLPEPYQEKKGVNHE